MFSNPVELIYLFVALAVCISVHEASHALMAYLLGDPTAKVAGRISLNPARHLDPLGTILIFFAHFGWGKPTPFNPHNLSHPRRDSALIALAGPISNLLTAFVVYFVYDHLEPLASTPIWLLASLGSIYSLSVVLFLFNLLPIAPLDGSKILDPFVPARFYGQYQHFLQKGPAFLIGLIILDRIGILLLGFSFLGNFIEIGFRMVSTLIALLS